MNSKPKFETTAIKSTENCYPDASPVSTPIYLSSTYHRNDDGSYDNGLIYSRNDNPNRKIVEKAVAKLENGRFAFAFGSGMAAISAVLQHLKSGDHLLIPDDIYYAVRNLLDQVLKRWELSYSSVDMSNLEMIKAAIRPSTKLIWLETPSNPLLKISDIRSVTALAKEQGILTAVDNTWATPVLQNPLELGADIVMHSSTKYFGGHSDVVGGCLVLNDDTLAKSIESIQLLSGAVPSPFDCWLIARGIQTLHLRMSKQSENAMQLAQELANHPKIKAVFYPGLASHPDHNLAKSQMSNGFGAMISVLIDGDEATAFEISTKLRFFKSATSLGGVESLVEHRKSVEGPYSPTPENLLRISVGIEHISDLIADWQQALG